MKSAKLGSLLDEKEMAEVKKFIDKNDDKGLRNYLNAPERKAKLLKKGVVSDYLYYNLVFQKDIIKRIKLRKMS